MISQPGSRTNSSPPLAEYHPLRCLTRLAALQEMQLQTEVRGTSLDILDQ